MGNAAIAYEHVRLPKCLLVEDSDFDRRRISRVLDRGRRVDLNSVPSLSQARYFLARDRFDVILLDNALPDGLGVDFALELRQDARHAAVPIVMVSDYPTPFIYDKAMAAKINIVVSKDDFQPKHLRDALKQAGARSSARM
ncbi:response regulator [Aliishimia ponticola]|uniref:Response regulator n=1 Tax=Aliishimia ponticola TaxID=2499833 RepID=A0A4S4NB45_9RHOB|nr:response regulator [Aliishimia ponticola]THH36604.1 response regulator [Aliishimia ponticola]